MSIGFWIWLGFWFVGAAVIALPSFTDAHGRATHYNFFGRIEGYTDYSLGRRIWQPGDPRGALVWLVIYPIISFVVWIFLPQIEVWWHMVNYHMPK
jgi:hypothetical protein